jgi:hypothetical protein
MSGHFPTGVSIGNDDLVIDSGLLAPTIGLSVEALKENMRKGLVTGIAETGVDEDAGRTRLTFRYGARIWRLVVEADGTLVEVPLPVGKAAPATREQVLSGEGRLHDETVGP